jgi:shikimate kinase
MADSDDIVLIGPARAGKSTLGKLLAERLGRPRVSLDEQRWRYYKEIGYDEGLALEYRARGGLLALILYWNLFTPYAIERLLQEYRHAVIDFGAGVLESRESFERVQRALAGYRNVVLLLPSPDIGESLRILRQRDNHPPADLDFDFNAYALRHHTYYDLARVTIYTAGKTPEESCAEILRATEL